MLVCACLLSWGQTVEIQGHLKVSVMEEDSLSGRAVVRQPDGTFAEIDPAVFVIRVLIDNGTADLESLLGAGQLVKTLLLAGYSVADLLGKEYQGGLIFYVDSMSGTGLISADADQSSGTNWGCSGVLIDGANGSSIGTGSQNTIDIEAGCSDPGIAADLCANLTLNNYSDWFLPSRDELLEMLNVLAPLGLGNFSGGRYWSSTQADESSAYDVNFLNGISLLADKGISRDVRAIRAF